MNLFKLKYIILLMYLVYLMFMNLFKLKLKLFIYFIWCIYMN